MNDLTGKKILFFSPKFFGYEMKIKEKMIELGAEVHYYDSRPDNGFLTKVLIKINKNIIKGKINSYYEEILERVKNIEYDTVFFIVPEAINRKLMEKIKDQHPKAKFILYMWDSFSNMKNILDIKDMFDYISSFDDEDCKKYEAIKFRPLFYADEYKDVGKKPQSCLYDVGFIGTTHSDRYSLLTKIRSDLVQKNLKVYYYLYFPGKLFFMIRKLVDSSFRYAKMGDMEFKPLNSTDTLERLGTISSMIDIHHAKQAGLTMRTIEMIGAKKKLITTNAKIKSYDFYSENNIYVLNREQPVIDDGFFQKPWKELDGKIYDRYSLEQWVYDALFV